MAGERGRDEVYRRQRGKTLAGVGVRGRLSADKPNGSTAGRRAVATGEHRRRGIEWNEGEGEAAAEYRGINMEGDAVEPELESGLRL